MISPKSSLSTIATVPSFGFLSNQVAKSKGHHRRRASGALAFQKQNPFIAFLEPSLVLAIALAAGFGFGRRALIATCTACLTGLGRGRLCSSRHAARTGAIPAWAYACITATCTPRTTTRFDAANWTTAIARSGFPIKTRSCKHSGQPTYQYQSCNSKKEIFHGLLTLS